MSKRKDKATKLVDAFDRAVRRHALKGSIPVAEHEQIDEDYFMTRSALQYHMDMLNKKFKAAQSLVPE